MRQDRLAWLVAATFAAALSGCGGNDTPASTAAPTDPAAAAEAASDAAATARASALLAQMTQAEKIQMVHGTGEGVGPVGGAGYIPGISRLGIPDYTIADSATGVYQTRLVGSSITSVTTGATSLPSPVALAASWDVDLAKTYGTLIATELRVRGFDVGLGGGVDLAREPRNGRTFEYMGEDPILAGNMIVARTQGTQSQNVVATIKHFAANDQETNRMSSNSVIDERTLRELSLLPFEIGVREGKPGNVMCAYNLVNGLKSCQNKTLLTDILKTEWGFKGTVQSDWFVAINDTALAANAGVDEEEAGSTDDSVGFLGVKTFFNQKLAAAIQAGTVPQSRLDDMVQRKLHTMAYVGLLDAPPSSTSGTIDQAAGDAVARTVAQQSMVLLRNNVARGDTAHVLPLAASSVKSILVVGGHADFGVLSGGGSALVPSRDANAVPCLKPTATVGGVTACATYYDSSPLAAIQAAAPGATVTYLDGTDATAAAAAAAKADVTIVFGTQWETEGSDLTNLSLPNATTDAANQAYDQDALITAVAESAKRTVVVLETGTAVTMPWLGNVDAVLEAWYPGMQGGPAIADVLFGAVNPSGKLPLSFPLTETDLPQQAISATNKQVVYAEGLNMGYRWYDSQSIDPLFPFGFGLSYTTFSYSNATSSIDASGNLTVNFTLTNTGPVAGTEVAEVYAALPAAANEPPQRLIGFKKVTLAPGAKSSVSVTVGAGRLAIWDVAAHSWRLPDGGYVIKVGGSSRDLNAVSTTQTITGRLLASYD